MILRSEHIASRLEQTDPDDIMDPLVIAPSPNIEDLKKSGSASVDLRLGTWFVSLRKARMSHLAVDGDKKLLSDGNNKRQSRRLSKMHYVPFGSDYFLHPGNFVLGTTLEWIRLPKDLFGYVVGKSSWGRRGLVIATATGVHPGFTGCLTLELSNLGEIPIAIKPGMALCQICLHTVQSGTLDHVDRSQFIGSRRPNLGVIKIDEFTQALADSKDL